MKKSLVALAALAVIGAASAQSSVTLYGVADLAVVRSAEQYAGQLGGNGVMNNGSSRLGVRGTEDLGGGLKANFNFEQGINAENGATDATTFQRAANLSLSSNFGTVLLGRTLTPSFYGVAAWELTGTANYSVVANKFGFAGSTGYGASNATLGAGAFSGPARNNSQISYTTPTMGGFTATLGYITNADFGPGVDHAKYDMNAIYRGGPLTVALSFNKMEKADGNAVLGAKYDFGMFQVAGSLQDAGNASKGFTIGGAANLGPVSLVLDVARDTNNESTDVLLEAKYPLSKRTFAYAAALRQDNTPAQAATAETAAAPAQGTRTSYGLGIRHNF